MRGAQYTRVRPQGCTRPLPRAVGPRSAVNFRAVPADQPAMEIPKPRALFLSLTAAGMLAESAASVPIDPTGSTAGWTPIAYPALLPDVYDDQRTGIPEADIVGDNANPAFYYRFCQATCEELGRPINPHAVRKIVATGIAVSEPDLVELIQHVLDHESVLGRTP